MKRTIILTAFALTAIPCLAYSDYTANNLFPTWLTILYIVLGIIQLIVVIAVLILTDDVKAIKECYKKANNCYSKECFSISDLRMNLLLDDKKGFKTSLLINFIKRMETLGLINDTEKSRKNKSIRLEVEELQRQLDIIGEELPQYIKKMETLEDYYYFINPKEDKTSVPNNKE